MVFLSSSMLFNSFGLFSILVASSSTTVVHGQDLAPLGVNDLSSLDYSYEANVDDNCMYALEIEFRHDETLPMGDPVDSTEPELCLPGVIADDGLPYQAGRWNWERFPEYIRIATGIDHPSLDWNPCGHPGPGWLTAHYDVHFYTVSPEFRATEMTCTVIPGTPVCDSQDTQDTNQGLGFFNFARNTATDEYVNAPEGFQFFLQDAVIHMGVHGFLPSDAPPTTVEWIHPSTILVEYNEEIVCFEPMIPHVFMSGTEEDHFYEEDITYVDQTVTTLPSYYSVAYKADTGMTHIILKGQSATCAADFTTAKTTFEATQDAVDSSDGTGNEDEASGTTTTTTRSFLTTVMMVGVASFVFVMA